MPGNRSHFIKEKQYPKFGFSSKNKGEIFGMGIHIAATLLWKSMTW